MEISTDDLRAAYERNGRNAAATARELGQPVTTIKDRLAREGLRDPMLVTGRSTLRDAEGNVVMEWEKTSLDREKAAEAQRAAFGALSAELTRIAPTAPPRDVMGHLCTVYTLTDCHVGALCWHKEGGSRRQPRQQR